MDYERIVLDNLPLVDEVVRFIARRHRLSPDDTDELRASVRLKLLENDYAVLRRFEGRSSIRTFLTTVVHHHFLDLRNARWGKWRPSAQARRLGPLAIELDRLLTRDGLSPEEAVEAVNSRAGPAPTREELQALVGQIPPRARRRFLTDKDLERTLGDVHSEDDVIRDIDQRSGAGRIEHALQAALAKLDPRDRLLLRLRFHAGLQVSSIARLLGEPQKGLYRRFESVMRVLRCELEARGVSQADVAAIVGHPASEFHATVSGETPGKSTRSPSVQ